MTTDQLITASIGVVTVAGSYVGARLGARAQLRAAETAAEATRDAADTGADAQLEAAEVAASPSDQANAIAVAAILVKMPDRGAQDLGRQMVIDLAAQMGGSPATAELIKRLTRTPDLEQALDNGRRLEAETGEAPDVEYDQGSET